LIRFSDYDHNSRTTNCQRSLLGCVTRLVYDDAHGQYVLDDQGEAWYGVWYVPREELEAMFGERPIIVKAAPGIPPFNCGRGPKTNCAYSEQRAMK
jgi:hypothetical protein